MHATDLLITESPEAAAKRALAERLFIGVYPAGLSYADRSIEVDGDYKRVAFLPYDTLQLEIRDHRSPLLPLVKEDAKQMERRKGEPFEISACGQTVTLGSKMPGKPNLIDAIMAIDLDEIKPVCHDRHIPRKQQAALARQLFKAIGLRGISVTTPNYSMAQVVNVRIPEEPHPGWAGYEQYENATYSDMPDDVPARRWSARHYAAEQKVKEILLRAFPAHDDRSDSMTDYYDYCWSIS